MRGVEQGAARQERRSVAVSLAFSTLRYHGVLEGDGANDFTRSLEAGLDTRVTILAATFSATAWLTPRFGTAVSLPYESRDLLNASFPPEGRSGERRHDNVSGLGDANLEARAVALDNVAEGYVRLVLAAGASLPTGGTRRDPLVGPTDATLQLGAGIVAPLAAAAAAVTLPGGHARLRLESLLRYPTYANEFGYRGGANLGYFAAYERLLGQRVVVAAGIYGSERGHDERRGFRIENSGGRTVGGRLAVSVSLGRWTLSAEGRIPAYRFVNGVQIVEELGAVAAVGYQTGRLF